MMVSGMVVVSEGSDCDLVVVTVGIRGIVVGFVVAGILVSDNCGDL